MAFQVYLRQADENGNVIFPGDPKKYGFCLTCAEHKEGDKLQCLQCLRSSKTPHSFSSQYKNDPIDSEAVEFKPTWIRRYEFTDDLVRKLQATKGLMSFDGATTLGKQNDYTGLVVTKRPDGQLIYVVEAAQRRLNPDEAIKWVFDLVTIHNVDTLMIDITSSQRLWLPLFRAEMAKRGKWITIIEERSTNRESKPEKIRGLIPFYANGRILHRPGLDDLEDQLAGFPRLVHDDIIDALSFQWKRWNNVPLSPAENRTTQPWTMDWWKKQTTRPNDRFEKLFGDLRRRG